MNYIKELKLGDPKTLEKELDLRVLSLGAGVQSSYVLLKMFEEEIAPADLILFADTGNEPKEVYEWLNHLKKLVGSKFKIEVVRNTQNTGHILKDYMSEEGRFGLIPTHIKKKDGKKGFGLRTCTSEYKIKPIQDRIRNELGVKHYLTSKAVEMIMGISIDEIQRAKNPVSKWQVNCYPLIENNISRSDCVHYFKHTDYGQPPRSACIVCPFHSNKEWQHLKDNHKEEFASAIVFDDWLRDPNSKSVGLDKFKKYDDTSEQYLFDKLIPLKDATFKEDSDYQYSLFDDECEGMCGV